MVVGLVELLVASVFVAAYLVEQVTVAALAAAKLVYLDKSFSFAVVVDNRDEIAAPGSGIYGPGVLVLLRRATESDVRVGVSAVLGVLDTVDLPLQKLA